MPTEKTDQSYLPWIAVAVLAFMLFQKQTPPAPVPPPVPPVPVVNVESVVAGIFPAQAKGYTTVFREAATQVKSKALVSEPQLFSFLKTEAENVRSSSAVEFGKLLNESIPDGNFGDTEVAAVTDFLNRVADAFESSAK